MVHATQHFHNRIALVFDFDKTLAPSSYDALIASLDLDPPTFRRERVQPLSRDGWDDTLARFFRLIEASNARGGCITRAHLRTVGQSLAPHPGVPEMFDRVRQWARAVVEDVEVAFYVLSCGFVDIQRATPLAASFEAMWGSEFHFDDRGAIAFAKQMITFPEKTRYMLQLSKGLGPGGPNAPADVYRPVPDEQIHVPLDQVVYVGDGGSDMPVFTLMHDHGGIALGVYDTEDLHQWSGYDDMRADRRVQNLARPDFREGSELMQSLQYAVESIAKLIALRRLSLHE